ncbi:MAG: tRNA pseudouridine(38-40) synthase TruA [Anaerolineae bacterium]|nr:tRNA pseudouridine(38-40) synthase TruA [Anaerolineae bacterium]
MTPAAPRRYRATVAYDGAGYQGFQRQAPGTPTIQGAIEGALRRVAGQDITIMGAGRTDTGVHATGQVIAWDMAWRHAADDLLRAVNANLPCDIALQALEETRADFHPRFDAQSRTYQYDIDNAPVRHPLYTRTAWHVGRPLDGLAMQAAAQHLLGEHDFAAFGRPPQGENTVRTVMRAAWAHDGRTFRFTIEANAFLQRMVRSLVGTMVEVGAGSISPVTFADILASADRARAAAPAPPHGLCLVSVHYLE